MFNNALLMAAASAAAGGGGYDVPYSCRFNQADGSKLSITNGTATSATTATFSCWFKLSNAPIASMAIFGTIGAYTGLTFNSDASLKFFHGSSGAIVLTTKGLFRDPSSWSHCVLIVDTTESVDTDRVKLFINGVQVDYTATTFPTASEAFYLWNVSGQVNIVGQADPSYVTFDGYMAEVHSIDGVAYPATTFGEFDDNGVWRPVEVTDVTYGNNGFYLDFADSSALGNDVSGNDNDLTSSGLAANDQVVDTPTTNFCTWNRIYNANAANFVFSDGNLTAQYISSTDAGIPANMFVRAGKWYFEIEAGDAYDVVGIVSDTCVAEGKMVVTTYNNSLAGFGGDAGYGYFALNGNIQEPATYSSYGDAYADGDVIGVALDLENDAIWFSKNDTWQNSATIEEIVAGTTTNAAASGSLIGINWTPMKTQYNNSTVHLNCGQTAFAGTVPTGFNKINTANLAAPTIKDGTAYFQPTLYIGTGAVQTIGQQTNSYSNKYGSGDREDIIASSGVGGSYDNASPVGTLVNGVTTAASGPGISSFATDMYWKFVFSQAVNITEVLIDMQSAGGNVGDSWIWEGSNNDFSSTTALSAAIDMSSLTDPEIHTLNLIGASDTYQYYRLRNTNGGGSNSTTWDEFNFKAAPLNADSTFQPDFVWLKNRSQADSFRLIDAPRGVTKEISSDATAAESTDVNGLTAFTSSGFTLGTGAGGYNDDTESFVAWQWLAGGGAGSSNEAGSINTTTTTVNTTSGISISTYTGTGATATVGHGLGVAPKMILVKNTSSISAWRVYHEGMDPTAPQDYYAELNTAGAATAQTVTWNDTAPTSTVFTIGSDSSVNESTKGHVAYCFADVEGFSKFGAYKGNGVVDGTFVPTGFKPAWIMIFLLVGGAWCIQDSTRNPYNVMLLRLQANVTTAETSSLVNNAGDFLANGFKLRTATGNTNANGYWHIYAAFAEHPFGGDGVTPATAF